MRKLKLPRLLIFALALLLVGGQQAALVHLLGHASFGTGVETTVKQGDEGHGVALTLSHTCTTCLALGAGAAPPPAARLPFAPAATVMAVFAIGIVAAMPQPAHHYLSHAPPLL